MRCTARTPISTVAEPAIICCIGAIGFVCWAIAVGPDLNFDFLNYHLYVGMHLSGDSLGKDFFPALGSSYLAPYAYWPMAAMVVAKWPAMTIGGVMGAIHSSAVIATWYLAKQLLPDDSRAGLVLRFCAAAIGVMCPLVLTEVGTSFIDITSAVPCVAGAALLLKALSADRERLLFTMLAGAGFG